MVYVVLVNWNGWKDTIECLESLLRLANQEFHVIVCDNGSENSSIEKILSWSQGKQRVALDGPPWTEIGTSSRRRREPSIQVIDHNHFPHLSTPPVVTIIDLKKNLGFAGACNVGIRLGCSDPHAQYIWLLNNDTVVDPYALDSLMARMRSDRSIGNLGSCLLYYDRPDTVQSLGGWYSPWVANGGYIGVGLARNNLPSIAEIERKMSYVAGASMFVPVGVLTDIGEMSEDYFLYYEEFDWAMRLKGKYRQSVCLESRVYHKEGASIGTNSRGRASDTSLYYLGINQLRFTAKHMPCFLPIVLARFVRSFIFHFVNGDRKAILLQYLVMADFILNRRRRGLIQI